MNSGTRNNIWTTAQSAFGFVMACLVGLISFQINTMSDHARDMQKELGVVSVSIARVEKELDTVKPRDVLAAVHESSRNMVTRAELREAIRETAPWANDKEQWLRWREGVDRKIRELEKR